MYRDVESAKTYAPADQLTIDRPEQLKALVHPLRPRFLELLGENDEQLTNRELAQSLGVGTGHLHCHVRMLLHAGLIERAEVGQRRHKPYRAVAHTVRVASELRAGGLSTDVHAAMLDEVQAGWAKFAGTGRFRSAQMTVRIDPERVRELWHELADKADELEDTSKEPLVLTLLVHPHTANES